MTQELLRDPDPLRSDNPRTQKQMVLQRKAEKRLKDRLFFRRAKAKRSLNRSEVGGVK